MFQFFCAGLFLLTVSVAPAFGWVEQIAEETEKAANDARCVGYVAYNDMVHILNAPSDPSVMSPSEARPAVLLSPARSDIGWGRVTRGGALPYEAVTRANTSAARDELSATLDRLSQAAITVFFAPYARENGVVRAEVTLLVRRNDAGRPILAGTPTVWVDVPVVGTATFRVSCLNTSRSTRGAKRVTTDWFVDATIELRDGRLQYTRIDPTSQRR